MKKLTARIVHLHDIGQYQCVTCGSKNTGIAGESLPRIGMKYKQYQGYCENSCEFKFDAWTKGKYYEC